MIGVPPLWPLRVLKHDLRTHFIRHRGSKLRWDKSNLHIKYGELITCIGPCIGNWFRLFAIGIQQISSLNSFMGPISFEASLKMFECIYILKCIVLWFYDSKAFISSLPVEVSFSPLLVSTPELRFYSSPSGLAAKHITSWQLANQSNPFKPAVWTLQFWACEWLFVSWTRVEPQGEDLSF